MRQRLFALIMAGILATCTGIAQAAPLDLTGFTVDVPSGSSSSVVETAGTVYFSEGDAAAIYFLNDTFVLPANATTLSFDYTFALGDFDVDDYLQFNINLDEQRRVGSSGTGHFDINMSSFIINGAPTTISLDWGLLWDFDEFSGTTARIYNIVLASNTGAAPVPEPGTLLLMGTGLAGLAGWRRKKS